MVNDHRDEGAQHPHQLEPGLEAGEGAAPDGVGGVALDDAVEGQLAGGGGHPGGAGHQAEGGQPVHAPGDARRAPPPAAARPAGCAPPPGTGAAAGRPALPTSVPTRLAASTTPNHHDGRPWERKAKATKNVRNPTAARRTAMAVAAMRTVMAWSSLVGPPGRHRALGRAAPGASARPGWRPPRTPPRPGGRPTARPGSRP